MNANKIRQIEQDLATHQRMFLQSDEMIQEEPKEFKSVPAGHFNITNQNQIEELSNIIKQNQKNKKQSFQVSGLQSRSEQKENIPASLQVENFKVKANSLFDALDNCKKQYDNQKSQQFAEQKYLYYNLEDVEYKDKEVISEAFNFLKDLERQEKLKKKREQLDNEEQILEEEFDILSFKPSYQQSKRNKEIQSSRIHTEEQSIKKKFKNLTIEDEDEYEIIQGQTEEVC